MDTRFLAVLLIVLSAAFAQTTPLAAVFGVKVGLALAAVFFSAFFVRTFFHHAALAALALAAISFPFGTFSDTAPLFAVFLAGYLVRRAASWQPWLSYPASLFAATFLLYALIDIRFLAGHPGIVLREGAYTAIFGAFLYLSIGLPHDVPRRHTF